MRRYIYQFHSWLGLIVGIALVVIGLTGSALVFKPELDRLVNPELTMRQNPDAPRMSLDTLIATLQAKLPNDRIIGWGKGLEPGAADMVYVIPVGESEGHTLYADPTTGNLTDPDPGNSQTMTNWLLELHYSFFADHTGLLIVGLLGVALCLLGISGVWIYRNFWKTLFQLRWKKSARIFFSDVHKMVGITSTAFNLVLGFTGAWWNIGHIILEWGHEEPVVQNVDRNWSDRISLDQLAMTADATLPGYETNWISLPMQPGGPILFFGAIDGQNVLRSDYGSTLSFDAKSGKVTSFTSIPESGIWAQIQDAFRPLHYGTFGGLPIKILWCIGGLTPGILAVSGALMWWQRNRRKFQRKNA
ncbi:PepSY domain-containing protein [Luteolibacter pohnpeiensis]|uniref:PepSY domain-containing protein n=1 Tax=Luteolibacter pohnpeiensis TaxID=454153 RepID=A0A934VVJ4_9BACT|nr:PepSY-associated TM helix domain-containing protein [Luteolibacter pohnpeiensis]MBK1882245.1 PepSY domain-containing protein [Luteolibacter pohnpeiensis]